MSATISRSKFIKSTAGLVLLTSTKIFANPILNQYFKPFGEVFHRNDKMKKAFELGLKILNPTVKQLEHGLELHRNSLVFDTYGFQPKASVDGKKIVQAMNENASQVELKDLQEDMTMTRYVENEHEKQEFMNAWNVSGVTCVFQNAGEEGNAVERLLKRLARFTYVTDMMPDFVSKAVRPEDIEKAFQENKKVLYFSGNGVPLPQNWVSLEDELRFIKIFYQLGIRMMHLTYNRRNVIGDGCGEPTDAGLSDFGRMVVKEMNQTGVIVDVAHSGWKTSLEAAKLSEKPIVASHSCAAGLSPVVRSKPDDVIKAIADSGGYTGVCCIPRFLGGNGDISTLMKHLDYIAKKFGPDYVTIGTDLGYSSSYSEQEDLVIQNSVEARTYRTRWEALWPEENSLVEKPFMRQSMMWTNWPLFTVGLVQLGYNDYDIRKIIGGNALRVAKAVFN